MSQIIDPSYSARMNNEKEKFGLVCHVPELPSPSRAYENSVLFLSTDGCFYECHLDGNNYVWDKQTFGPKRQFIISATWIVPGSDGYSFNDEVNTIRRIVTEMKKYDSYFESLENEYPSLTEGTMNLIEACSITDKLTDYVNKYCDAGLSHVEIDTDGAGEEYVDPPAATCEMLATYINEVVGILNPHAGFSVLAKEVAALRELIGNGGDGYIGVPYDTVYSWFRPVEDGNSYEDGHYYSKDVMFDGVTPVYNLIASESDFNSLIESEDEVYKYTGPEDLWTTTDDGTESAKQKFDFSSNNFYFTPDDPNSIKISYYIKGEISVVTPVDFNLLRNTFSQFVADQTVANGKFKSSISSMSGAIESLRSAIGNEGIKGDIDKIIGTYLGINPSEWTNETKSLVSRISDLNRNITDASVDGSIAKIVKSISNIISGVNGQPGLSAVVADLAHKINDAGTGLRSVVGDSNGGLVKDVNTLKTKVNELEASSGSSKIQSIDERIRSAGNAFRDISKIFSNVPRAYTETSDPAPIPGKRYWVRNDQNGEYEYTLAADVTANMRFTEGVVYYESNLSQDDLADAVWTIVEKSATIARALNPLDVGEGTEETENQGD